jgi:hypothetical protein
MWASDDSCGSVIETDISNLANHTFAVQASRKRSLNFASLQGPPDEHEAGEGLLEIFRIRNADRV